MDRFKFNENIKSNEIAFQMGGFFRICKCNKHLKNNLHQTEKKTFRLYFIDTKKYNIPPQFSDFHK